MGPQKESRAVISNRKASFTSKTYFANQVHRRQIQAKKVVILVGIREPKVQGENLRRMLQSWV